MPERPLTNQANDSPSSSVALSSNIWRLLTSPRIFRARETGVPLLLLALAPVYVHTQLTPNNQASRVDDRDCSRGAMPSAKPDVPGASMTFWLPVYSPQFTRA